MTNIDERLYGNMTRIKTAVTQAAEDSKKLDDYTLIELIKANQKCYEEFYKGGFYIAIASCRMLYGKLREEAKSRGLDISRYPDELNYLERQN